MPIPFIWSNDDITHGKSEQLQRQLDFIERFGIRGVFFVIPRAGNKDDIDTDATLVKIMRDAQERGHEFYQHGYIHTPFESGVPETWMLDFAPDVRRQFDEERLTLEKQHTLAALTEMIEKGAVIWRRTFGEDSVGYRPGWGAFCGNLYTALESLGFEWCSSRIPSPTSWLWNNGLWNEPMNFRAKVPAHPNRVNGIVEYALGGDYGFRIPDEQDKIDKIAQLAVDETMYLHDRGWPMIICSHWHGLEWANNTGYRAHEKFLTKLLESGKITPMGMKQLHAEWGHRS
jgi:peptidoglycan/xylan/chitin deacetylase (PgdA/CDA1 family)